MIMSLPVGISFIRTVNGHYVTATDEYNCRRYLCFTTVQNATKCIDYCAEFRSNHGYWPEINLSQQRNKIETIEFKKRSPEKLKKFFEIEFHSNKEPDDACKIYHVPFLVCHDFNFAVSETDFQLFLSAQALDCQQPNMYESISILNKLLNK